MPESPNVIVVRLVFLEHSLNSRTASFEIISGFPVLMELKGFVYDQVFKVLLSKALKSHYSLTSHCFPGCRAHSSLCSSKCSPFTFLPQISAYSSFKTCPLGDVSFPTPFLILRSCHTACSGYSCYGTNPPCFITYSN